MLRSDELTAGHYYARHKKTGKDTIIRVHGSGQFLRCQSPYYQNDDIGDFTDFESVPSREQWAAAQSLQQDICEGAAA